MNNCTKNQRDPKLPQKKGTKLNKYYMTAIYHSLNMRPKHLKSILDEGKEKGSFVQAALAKISLQ